MRALYAKRRDALIKGLRDLGLEPHNADAGLHVSLFLPKSVDDRERRIAAACRTLGEVLRDVR